MNDEFIEELRAKFDLNLYEVKIWLALLSKGVSSAGELSTESNVPRSRTYDVLESLETKGFIILKMSKPLKYMAVEPEHIIENFKKNILKKADDKVKKITDFKDSEIFMELNQFYNKGLKSIEPTDLSGIIKGRHNIYNYMNNLIKNSKNSVIISTSTTDFSNNLSQLQTEISKAKQRGVNVKIMTPSTDLNILNSTQDLGNLKSYTNDMSRFIISDNSELLFLLANDKEIHPKHDVGIWVKSDSFASSVNLMFNHMWEKLN